MNSEISEILQKLINSTSEESYSLVAFLNDTVSEDRFESFDNIRSFIAQIFGKHNGLLHFVNKVYKDKEYNKSSTKALEVVYVLLNSFPYYLEKHLNEINETILLIIKCMSTHGNVRVKALELYALELKKYDEFDDNYNHSLEIFNYFFQMIYQKNPDSVSEILYICIGLFVKKFGILVEDQVNKIFSKMISEIYINTKSHKISQALLNGLIEGLKNVCYYKPLNEDKDSVKKLYPCLKQLSAFTSRIKVCNRAAVLFLDENVSDFSDLIFNDRKYWLQQMNLWIKDYGPEEKKVAVKFLVSCYEVINKTIVDNSDESYKVFLQRLLISCNKTRMDPNSSIYDKKCSILGIGIVAPAAKKLFTESEFNNFYLKFRHIYQQTYLKNLTLHSDDKEYLPDYVRSISHIILTDDSGDLLLLTQSLIAMVKIYPEMPFAQKNEISKVFLQTILSCNSNIFFEKFFPDLILNCVSWSCSHEHASESAEGVVTVRDYFPFWLSVLNNLKAISNDPAENEIKKIMHNRVVQRIILTLIVFVMNKLDVSLSKDSDQINNVNDYKIFLNVVDFYEKMLIEIEPIMLSHCINKLLILLVQKSNDNRQISGFYKLISTCLIVANKTKYFENETADSINCLDTLKKFLQILLTRINNFKDELLMSCFKVFLTSPVLIIRDIISETIPVFKAIFSIGRIYLPLSNMAINTLEHWQKNIPNELMEPFLQQVVPLLDDFISHKSSASVFHSLNNEPRRKTLKSLDKRRVNVEIEPELFSVQKKVLKFIAKQNSKVCKEFLNSSSRRVAHTWSVSSHLKVQLPNRITKIEIVLDRFVPKIISLALYCSDRNMRVTACELLHSTVIIFLGNAKQMNRNALSDSRLLFKKLLSAVLHLACDLDSVVNQLFHPLMLQIVHWYANLGQLEHLHGEILLDSIMEGVATPLNAAVQEFCGLCIQEYLTWFFRRPNIQGSDVSLLELFLNRIKFFSNHPNPFNKAGACIIFNNIYPTLIQHEHLIKLFWLEYVKIFSGSLSLIESDLNDEFLIRYFNKTLHYLGKGFLESPDSLLYQSIDQELSSDIFQPTLLSVSECLYNQLQSESRTCRAFSQETLEKIVPLFSEKNTISLFVNDRTQDLIQFQICDKFNLKLSDNPDRNLIEWMQKLERSLDIYMFFIKHKVYVEIKDDELFDGLNIYLNEIESFELKEILNLIERSNFFNILNNNIFNELKIQINIKIMTLVQLILVAELEEFKMNFWSNFCIFMRNQIFKCKNRVKLDSLLILLKYKVPNEKWVIFHEVIYGYIRENFMENVDFAIVPSLEQRNCIDGMLFLQKLEIESLEVEKFAVGFIERFFDSFFMFVEKGHLSLSTVNLNYYKSLLKLSLCNQEEIEVFVSKMYHEKMTNQTVNYFLNNFEDILMIYVKNFDLFMNYSLAFPERTEKCIFYIEKIFAYLESKKYQLPADYRVCVTVLLNKWDILLKFFTDPINIEIALNFIDNIFPIKFDGVEFYCEPVASYLYQLIMNLIEIPIVDLNFEIKLLKIFLKNSNSLRNIYPSTLRLSLQKMYKRLLDHPNSKSKEVKIKELCYLIQNIELPEIFEFVIQFSLIYEDSSDIYDAESLLQIPISKMSAAIQLETMKLLYRILGYESEFNCKLNFLQKVIVKIFRYVTLSSFRNFYIEYINPFVTLLQIKSTDQNVENQIMHTILVEIMFSRVPLGANNDGQLFVTNPSRNEQVLELIKNNAVRSFKNCHNICGSNKEKLRLFRCYNYNLLITIATNMSRDTGFINILLQNFEDDSSISWRSLINQEKKYNFEKDFHSIPTSKKITLNIRTKCNFKTPDNPIERNAIFNSSLSEDITKYDFNFVQLRKNPESELENDVKMEELMLDMVDFNEHECMATICGLINHLQVKGIISTESKPDYLPDCLLGLRNLLFAGDTPENIKIFVVRVILNEPNIFEPYFEWFLEPLLKFIIDGNAGYDLNYFILELVSMLVLWSSSIHDQVTTNLLPKINSIINKFFQFLFNAITSERKDIFKYALDLIKSLLSSWKISIPCDHILKLIDPDNRELNVEKIIHLSSVLLLTNSFHFELNNEKELLDYFFLKIGNEKRGLYVPAAENIGLYFRNMGTMGKNRTYLDKIDVVLDNINDFGKFANILNAITLHFPECMHSKQFAKTFGRLISVPPSVQVVLLKTVLRVIEVRIENSFLYENWSKLLDNQNMEVQIVTLSIFLSKIFELQANNKFPEFIKSICGKYNCHNVLCRKLVYDIIIKICGSVEKCIHPNTYPLCKETLIAGLVDDDKEIRDNVINFFVKSALFESIGPEQFFNILLILYKTETEDKLLSYGTYFIIDLLMQKQNCNESLFQYPLENCNFENYELDTESISKSLVTPMFLEKVSYSLTQNSQNIKSQSVSRNDEISQITRSQSQLLIGSRNEIDSNFKNPNKVDALNKYKYRRRFLKDKTKISAGVMNYEIGKMVKASKNRVISAKLRDQKINVYREYRKGDFPDIQISLTSVLIPLKMLSLENPEVAAEFSHLIIESIHQNSKDLLYDLEFIKFTNKFMNESVHFNPNIFRTILNYLILSKNAPLLIRENFDLLLIRKACLNSGLLTIGTILFEDLLENGRDDGFLSVLYSKKSDRSDNGEENIWLSLAELYRAMGEYDIVRSIFQNKILSQETIYEAIVAESNKEWQKVITGFKKLIDEDLSVAKRDFFYFSYFNAFANSGMWSDLLNATKSLATESSFKNHWDSMWDGDWKQKEILPWYINAEINNMLFSKGHDDIFLENVDNIFNNSFSDNAEYMRINFPEQLLLLWLLCKDFDTAADHLSIFTNNFLNKWQSLDPLLETNRHKVLMKMQVLNEIENFLRILKTIDTDDAKSSLSAFRPYWNNILNKNSNSLAEYETSTLYHKQYIEIFKQKLLSSKDNENIVNILDEIKFKFDDRLIDKSINEKNYQMAKKYCQLHRRRDEINIKQSKLLLVQATITRDEEGVQRTYEAIELLKALIDKNEADNTLSLHVTLFDGLVQMVQLIRENPNTWPLYEKRINWTVDRRSAPLAPENLLQVGTERLMEVIDRNLPNNGKDAADAYAKLAKYLSGTGNPNTDRFILCVLRGMKLNSKEARQLFPYVLADDSLGDYEEIFCNESQSVPLWMFLRWIPQILSNLNSDKVKALAPIAIKIAEEYPQALMYPYRISKETYNYADNYFTEIISRLDKLLMNKEIDEFILALSFIGSPQLILRYYMEKLAELINLENYEGANDFKNNIIDILYSHTPNAIDPECFQGNSFRSIKEYKKQLQRLNCFNKNNALLLLNSMMVELKNASQTVNNPTYLRDLCPWLEKFTSSKFKKELEIPGQYHGQSMPLVQYHVKIEKFHSNIRVMHSIRKPVKITIIGNDSKEYPFLIKFGEDIRQDERIEQIFALTNEIFETDETKQETISTYKVVPLSSSLGMIQWVENTTKLIEFMGSASTEKISQILSVSRDKYLKWIRKSSSESVKNELSIYQNHANRKHESIHSRSIFRSEFQAIVNEVDVQLLRKALWKLSLNCESYAILRLNFIKSYATMCAVHWLLGIGDRHLENTLIDRDTGRLIGIDFGHAFGTATQFLAIPELVPFRLTSQFIATFGPLQEQGLFKESMIHTIACLRKNKIEIGAAMNVFIKEPSLDWTEKKRDCREWNAHKINQVIRKLEGANSTVVMIEDLKAGGHLNVYVNLVEGCDNVRGDIGKDNLSVQDQVDGLIDHATDYLLLGRMYEGWTPWM